jgi:hypothetical protein
MSDANSSAPKKSSIAERIAALNQNDDTPLPTLTKPVKSTGSALSARIAALQKNAESSNEPTEAAPKAEKKVGKLKPPAGAVPIMPFGAGPPPSVIKKQKEREERMAKLQQEAKSADVGGNTEEEKPKVGKLKPPAGAVPIMPFGAGPPPSLLKKQREREEEMKKLQEEANSTEEDGENGAGAAASKDVNVEDALLSRPTVKGKRRPRTRV